MDEFRKKTSKELDDFWDIDSLLPKTKEAKQHKFVPRETKTIEISSSAAELNAGNSVKSEKLSSTEFTRFISPHDEKRQEIVKNPDIEYNKENSLIRSVKIFNSSSKYNFYERFIDDAKKLWNIKGEEAPKVPFFSYSPQYSQLNRAQLSYYLWWRENVRKGSYKEADYSYILLYVYEIINLSETLDREYCLNQLCLVWTNYGNEYQFLGRYLCEWICDFCLINDMEAPSELLHSVFPQIMKNCTLKEFYITFNRKENNIAARTLIDILGAYDYRTSKCATQERLPIMEKYLMGALDETLKKFARSNQIFFGIGSYKTTAIRNAYTGALCSKSVTKKIEVEYQSLIHSYELRYIISDIIKYAENRLRKAWKVKSRLSIYALPTDIKNFIDDYFDNILGNLHTLNEIGACLKKNHEEAEYEKLYYVPNKELSLSRASEIENDSWETTRILVETFTEEDKTKETVSNETTVKEKNEPQGNGVFADKLEYIKAILFNDTKSQMEFLKKKGILAEALVDEINEIAVDEFGDILIEHDGEKYVVIEEYKDIVQNL